MLLSAAGEAIRDNIEPTPLFRGGCNEPRRYRVMIPARRGIEIHVSIKPRHAGHQEFTDVFAHEGGQHDEGIDGVRISNEPNFPELGEMVDALASVFFQDRMQLSGEWSKKAAVLSDSPDLSTNGEEGSSLFVPNVEQETFHGMKIGGESVNPLSPKVVEASAADDLGVGCVQYDSSFLECTNVLLKPIKLLVRGDEPFSSDRPALRLILAGTVPAQRRLWFAKEASQQLAWILCGLVVVGAIECACPRFAEGNVVARNERFGIIEILA